MEMKGLSNLFLIGLLAIMGLSSCSVNKTAVYVPENIANMMKKVDSLSISDDRLLVLESVMKTREFKNYVKSVKKRDKKMDPVISELDKKVIEELKKNVQDADYVSKIMANLESKVDIEYENMEWEKALNKLENLMEKKDFNVFEKAIIFINARERTR